MIDNLTKNAAKPKENKYGYAMLDRMNDRHKPLHAFGLGNVKIGKNFKILDIGFGGGQNIFNLMNLYPDAKICGIDYSSASLKKCSELNKKFIEENKVKLDLGNALQLPYNENEFNLAIAFETIYYWENIEKCFYNICKTLKKNGQFLICNEDSSIEGNEEIAKTLNMTFYDEKDLKELLLKSGFSKVDTYKKGKWVSAVGTK